MVRMLGENILPESVNSQRRRLRRRVRELRDPLRQRREQLVPGPDIVGSLENRFSDLRNRVVERDSVLSNITARRSGGDGDSGDGSSSNGGSTSGGNNAAAGMT